MSDTRGALKNVEDPSTKDLNLFVQNLLKQMQDRFEDMSGNIIGRIDEMGNPFFTQAGESTTSRSQSGKS